MGARFDLTGQRFGAVVVTGDAGRINNSRYWHFVCDCGFVGIRATDKLYYYEAQDNKECGGHRLHGAHRHGYSRTPVYAIWCAMLARCYNPNVKRYRHYGGRGIKVCDRWRVFTNFMEDMGLPRKGVDTIDRIDVDGDYEPRNCRWVSRKENNRNKQNTIYVVYKGSKMPLVDLAEMMGIPRKRLAYTLDKKKGDITAALAHYGL